MDGGLLVVPSGLGEGGGRFGSLAGNFGLKISNLFFRVSNFVGNLFLQVGKDIGLI